MTSTRSPRSSARQPSRSESGPGWDVSAPRRKEAVEGSSRPGWFPTKSCSGFKEKDCCQSAGTRVEAPVNITHQSLSELRWRPFPDLKHGLDRLLLNAGVQMAVAFSLLLGAVTGPLV